MDRPLVLHSGPLRWALAASAPVVLLGLGGAALRAGGGVGAGVSLAAGVVTAAVVLWDLPRRVEFSEHGVVRVCVLRRHHLPWGRVVALERLTSGLRLRRALLRDTDGERQPPARAQGLSARLGARRSVLLVDRRESHAEHVALRRLAAAHGTPLRAAPPPVDAVPAGRGPDALHRR